MRLKITLFVLALMPFIALAQKLNNASSFIDAVTLSEQLNKPILLIVKSPASASSKMPKKVINSEKVVDLINANFVVFETDRTDKTVNLLLSRYKITRFPAFLFMHNGEDIFHSDFGYTTNENKYLAMVNKGISLSNDTSLTTLQQDYSADKTDNEKLKKLINARMNKGLTDNAELVQQFANNLRLGDLNDYQTVLFILKAGPYADGGAYKLAYTNRKITDSIYRTETPQVRSAINSAIISNTMNNAIKTKNITQALAAANISRSISRSDYQRSQRNHASNMIHYYKSVGDTTSYFNEAGRFYDTFYMKLSADSMQKIEAETKKRSLDSQTKAIQKTTKVISKAQMDSLIKANPTMITRRDTMRFSTTSSGSTFALGLNNAAWNFYQTGTTNINHLTKAMIWSRRAIELNANGGYYDTLAHILYRMGYFAEAVKTQEDGIALAKIQKRSVANMQEELKKMKSRTL